MSSRPVAVDAAAGVGSERRGADGSRCGEPRQANRRNILTALLHQLPIRAQPYVFAPAGLPWQGGLAWTCALPWPRPETIDDDL